MQLTVHNPAGTIKEDEMGRGLLQSFIPQILEELDWDRKIFKAHCLLNGVSADTADRLYYGETNVYSEKTLARVTRILGRKSIAEVMDLREE